MNSSHGKELAIALLQPAWPRRAEPGVQWWSQLPHHSSSFRKSLGMERQAKKYGFEVVLGVITGHLLTEVIMEVRAADLLKVFTREGLLVGWQRHPSSHKKKTTSYKTLAPWGFFLWSSLMASEIWIQFSGRTSLILIVIVHPRKPYIHHPVVSEYFGVPLIVAS